MTSRAITVFMAVALGAACSEGGLGSSGDLLGERSDALLPLSCEADSSGEVVACAGEGELRANCFAATSTPRIRRIVTQTFVAEQNGAPGRVRLVARLLEPLHTGSALIDVEIHPVAGGRVSGLPEHVVAHGSFALGELVPGEDTEISVILNSGRDLQEGEPYAIVVRIPVGSEAAVGLACLASGSYDDGELMTRDLRRFGHGESAFDGPESLVHAERDLAFVVSVGDGCRGGTQVCGTGACQREMPVCVDGVPQECVPGDPSEEICDGIDNDCDGIVDNAITGESEPLTLACYTGPEGTEGVGTCAGGARACVAVEGSGEAAWGDCNGEVLPAAEVCNGLDDNCDGYVDNANDGESALITRICYSGPADTRNVGLCRDGTETCAAQPGSNVESWSGCADEVLPSQELCDGLDNNCDGQVDEGDPEGGQPCEVEGLFGLCRLGQTVCTESGIECRQTVFPQAEVCDGLDNDCDGFVDNADLGSPQLLTQSCYDGDPGTRGVGQCSDGRQECAVVPGSGDVNVWGECTGQTQPTLEVCDGLDNDCDGNVDNAVTGQPELITEACYTGPAGTEDVGMCHGGTRTCAATILSGEADWSSCEGEVVPAEFEVCDGYDNDCDGFVDNALPGTPELLTEVCYPGPAGTQNVGICKAGFTECRAPLGGDGLEVWSDCEGYVVPEPAEICDGLDNDCDGFVDNETPGEPELLTQACYTGPAETQNEGVCEGGEQTCRDGEWEVDDFGIAVCAGEVLPSTEICDGVDNNCDGLIDEGNPPAADGREVGTSCTVPGALGQCAIGTWQCTSGGMVCVALYEPSAEVCDGLDNDCDGFVDNMIENDPAPLTEVCYSGPSNTANVGVCKRGTRVCVDGAFDRSECPGEVVPSAEICDGLDNNCDGFVDNQNPGQAVALSRSCYDGDPSTRGVGECRAGTQVCTDGEWPAACPGQILPTAEVCDGKDNDCDGFTDAADSDLVLVACQNQLGVCSGAMRPAELCQEGSWVACGSDQYMAHSPHYRSTEICDGFDNDCDGIADNVEAGVDLPYFRDCYEGPSNTRNVGVCRGGRQECTAVPLSGVASWTSCLGQILPSAEVCDNLDNDCDSFIDNPVTGNPGQLTQACYTGPASTRNEGACTDGTQMCVLGSWHTDGDGNPICNGQVLPKTETCNNVDDDCDGFVDNAIPNDPDPLTETCYTGPAGTSGVGLCKSGARTCAGGIFTPSASCPGEVVPTADVCDGFDNDCDGRVDNVQFTDDPLSRSCYSGAAETRDVGECRSGTQVCAGGAWPAVCAGEVLPGLEVCDLKDNDCDGYVDNAVKGDPALLTRACYTGPANTSGVGECRPGLQTCEGGTFGAVCPGEVTPTTEICNNKDDDCDSQIDENMGTTSCGEGVCRRNNVANCVGGVPQECVPDWSKQTTEVCNGLDDNCDGVIDNATIGQMCPPHTSVNATMCGGVSGCAIDECKPYYHDLDGLYSNGCECLDDTYAATCGDASQVTSLLEGQSFNADIARLPYSGDSDWYVVRFPSQIESNTKQRGESRIWLSTNTGGAFRFQVLAGSCQGGAYSGDGGPCTSGVTEWSARDVCDVGDQGCRTRDKAWTESIVVRVYRTTGGNACTSYRLSASRLVF